MLRLLPQQLPPFLPELPPVSRLLALIKGRNVNLTLLDKGSLLPERTYDDVCCILGQIDMVLIGQPEGKQ